MLALLAVFLPPLSPNYRDEQCCESGSVDGIENLPIRTLAQFLIIRGGDHLFHGFLVVGCQLRRSQLESHFVDLAGKVERYLVVVIVHWRAGVRTDVQSLVKSD